MHICSTMLLLQMLMPSQTASLWIQDFSAFYLAGTTSSGHINKAAMQQLTSGIMQTSSSGSS